MRVGVGILWLVGIYFETDNCFGRRGRRGHRGMTDATDKKRLKEIRVRLDGATDGPWYYDAQRDISDEAFSQLRPLNIPIPDDVRDEDAEFLVNTREDVPWLLRHIMVLEETEAVLIKKLKEKGVTYPQHYS